MASLQSFGKNSVKPKFFKNASFVLAQVCLYCKTISKMYSKNTTHLPANFSFPIWALLFMTNGQKLCLLEHWIFPSNDVHSNTSWNPAITSQIGLCRLPQPRSLDVQHSHRSYNNHKLCTKKNAKLFVLKYFWRNSFCSRDWIYVLIYTQQRP